MKIKCNKTSKGYKLKASTHKLISKLQNITGSDHDSVLWAACTKLLKEVNIDERNSKVIENLKQIIL